MTSLRPAPRETGKRTGSPAEPIGGGARRRKRDRAATEAALMDAALRLIERNGVLAGLNMQEVADEAGVNRGLIHHYFGSRRALLRAAVDRGIRMSREAYEEHRRHAPEEKAEWNFGLFMEHPGFARLVMLLALDGDTSFGPIAFAHERVRDMEREKAEGALPRNTDPVGLVTFWDAILLGYTVIRESAAAQFGIPVTELDARVRATLMQPPSAE